MKTIMITAPSSNTGKTTLTLGLIRAMRNRGMDVSAFKTGPDFIDTKYLKMASRKNAGNLDIHLMGRENLKKSLGLNPGDYGVIEGAMGYFDGIFNSFENSSYDISKELDLPAILVYRPKGEMFSAVPKIKGMVDFSNGRIKGIILNKCSRSTYLLLKPQIEKYIGIRVLGHLEERESIRLEESSLGLEESDEEKMERIIEGTSKILEESLDLDSLISLMEPVATEALDFGKKYDLTLAVARDRAFNFHYNENLKILAKKTKLIYFSPLDDKCLPKADLVYIGGGYPENYLDLLEANTPMKSSIKSYVDGGGYLVAEGGGFMYLTNKIEDREMVGVFNGETRLVNKLERFGYVNIDLVEDSILGKKGSRLFGNEYHKSRVEMELEPIFHITKPMSKKNWTCGYAEKNALGYYQHINFLNNMEVLDYLLDSLEKEVD